MAAVRPELWQKIIQRVISTGGYIIQPWFTQLEPISIDHGLLEILAPGRREQKYCQEHASQLFTEAAQDATGRLVSVNFLTPQDIRPNGPDAQEGEESVRLNDDYLFENFVTGPCNRLAHAACVAVSDAPGKAYNPLFIHGSVGLGKTHLLQATCQKITRDHPNGKLCVISCETFVNHFIQAVEEGKLHEFRYRYRHADILAIDDIQFLSDHDQTQEEFFHTFNTLYQTQKQIILTSDRGPHQIPDLKERLVSRFNWGLVARIDKPGYETRVAIVNKKAKLRGIELPQDVVCFIAGTIDSNTRELEGAIIKIAMLANVTHREINLDLAQEALGAEKSPTGREVTIEDILNAVTSRFNVRIADLQSKKRSRSIAFPRQLCMYLARNLTRHSLEEIGGYFGGRDHTTVLHANRTIKSQLSINQDLQATVEMLTYDLQRSS